ncbi:amino acid transporter [Sporormia fimetaria CBS 119925]|uniref:Amino acid transporter n=1 Tax=Sporormia fimetaria CBS 119925 TaxID=1340428 RepID=A0A6A6VJU3_9PLEO|nr:amino acid transporter [Sporormia fimetaria CBS 119925]
MAEKAHGLASVVADVEDGCKGPEKQRDGDGGATTIAKRTQQASFDRYINILGIYNFGICLQAGWEAVGLSLSMAFFNGGPAVLIYGTIISTLGHFCVAMSFAEMASMDPTIGAQYRWSARFAQRWPEFWGLLQGWLTTFAWVLSCVAPLSFLALITQTLIGFWDLTYQPKPWHVTLIMWAFLVAAIVCNLFLRKILNTLETIGGICHVVFFIVIIAVLATLGGRSSPSFVFGTVVSDVSGWNNSGVSFHIGLLAVILPLFGYDSVIHMVDETKKPRERVPKAMIFSLLTNGVMQLAYLLCVLFYIGDVDKVSASPLPILEICYQATKSKAAATVMLLLHAFSQVIALFNIVASASRLTWAFARDKGLPFHEQFSRLHPTLKAPLEALALVAVISVILSLINLGSTVALSAILAIPSVVLLLSYFPPIFHIAMRKLSGRHPRYGPFKLGSWGLPLNCIGMAFSLYAAFWAAFPSSYPVSNKNMNYAGPVCIALVLFALLDWFTTGKKRFEVPVGAYSIEMEDESEVEVRGDDEKAVSQ